jgi:hypothetical protein
MAYKQHFIEWFSGKQLPSYWTTTNISGTNTFAMDDAVDGGFKITTGTGGDNRGTIKFNGKRQYSNTASVCISVFKRVTGDTRTWSGFTTATGDQAVNSGKLASITDESSQTYKRAISSDGSALSGIVTTIPTDTSYHSAKVEMRTSDFQATIDGSLQVTKSTNLPTAKLEPVFGNWNIASGAKVGHITYMECYNT